MVMDINEDISAINQEARITKYLKGLMTKEEELAFLSELKQDAELRSMAITQARMVRSMRTVGSENDKVLMAAIMELEGEESIKKSISSITGIDDRIQNNHRIFFLTRKTFVSFSVAASILLCFWGGYKVYDNHQMAVLGSEYLAYFPVTVLDRGTAYTVHSKIDSLYHSVESCENIEMAIEELEPMWSESQREGYNDYTVYSSQIGWLLANAYVINTRWRN